MRNGEVRALQVRDIGIDRINVLHNFSHFDGLKGTKNSHERGIPIPKEIRAELLKAAEGNPLGVTPEACALLGISRTDGYRKVKSGEIPSRRIGQRILIPASWVHSFQEVAAS
jgi:excisionase family DNA binding protein